MLVILTLGMVIGFMGGLSVQGRACYFPGWGAYGLPNAVYKNVL
jgi:hypothetical protein